MKVLLIAANAEQTNMPVLPVGLACVAAAANEAGHDVHMVDLMFSTDVLAELDNVFETFRPECIGISVRNIDDQNMAAPRFLLDKIKDIVAACRQRSNAPIVLGGAGYTMFQESALAYLDADMGIAGEGEDAFPMLLSRLERNRNLDGIPGLVIRGNKRRSGIASSGALERFAMPGPALFSDIAGQHPDPWIPVQTRRGCPFNCTYCSTASIEGTRLRRHAPEHVAAWLHEWVRAGFSNFFFVDNTFNFPLSYAKELCRQIIAQGLDIRWQAIIYPKGVDHELATLMAAAGCNHISLGFESGSPRMLQQMNKRFTPEEVRTISCMFAELGVERMGFLLLGMPGETKDTVDESLAFAESLHLELLSLTPGVRLYPNTALAATAVREGILNPDDDLLLPRFYLAPKIVDWIGGYVKQWAATRPYVMM